MKSQSETRWRRSAPLAMLALAVGLSIVALPSLATHGGTLNGVFEATDGDLAVADGVDWNSFTDATTADAWQFTAATDDTGNKDGSIFTKNTKNHSFECPNVGSGSMGGGGNKDDLYRMYLANQNIDGDEWLFLSWTRVFPQNSTSAAANLSFEFNQAEETCAESADYSGTRNSALKVRTDGDLLVLYDFTGGADQVDISISTWTDSGPCEVGSASPPCWGPVSNLTASNDAEGRVNVSTIGPVFDAHLGEDIGIVAFGEGAINLTSTGIFDPDGDCSGFGSATGISRSSGNSVGSSLSDLIGPVDFNITNCGSALVEKVDHNGDPLDGAEFTISPTNDVDDPDAVVMTEIATGIFCADDLFGGTYHVFETVVPDGYTGADSQTVNVVADGSSCGDTGRADDDPDATFENLPEPGDVEITKLDDDDNPLQGVTFELFADDGNGNPTGAALGSCETNASGACTIENVDPGDYCVVEDASTVPDGYTADTTPQCFTVDVIAGGDLVELAFENPREHKVIVIVCHEGTDTLAPSDVTDGTAADDYTTIGSGDVTPEEQDFLCGLDGHNGEPHGDKDLTVDVGSDAHS